MNENDNTAPIRVLNMFTILDRGGAETMVMNYYRNIDRTKVQFDFLVHRDRKGAYEDEIEEMGGRIYRMCPIFPQNFAKYKKMLHEFFKEHSEYKIIHSHMSELGYFALREAQKQGVPVRICHAHSAPTTFDLKLIMRTYFKKMMMPYVTHMFMCGEASGEWLFGKQNADKFIPLNNAIPAENYIFNQEKREKKRKGLGLTDEFTLGHVGRFGPEKNHTFLLDVFNEVLKKEPNSVLLLAGDGVEMQKIQAKANALGIKNRIRFLGVRSDIPELMQAMDVFVFPSKFEGLGIVLVEAQASGLPSVVSDTIPDEAFLTELPTKMSLSASPEKWADMILSKRGSERPDMYDRISAAGFDVTKEAEKLQKFYEGVYRENMK